MSMANELNEMQGPVNPDGRDVNVIEKQLQVKVGVGSLIFEIALWVLGIIPGLIFLFMKINAKKYFNQLQQRDRKSTRLNSSHVRISYAVFCLKKKKYRHQKALCGAPQ